MGSSVAKSQSQLLQRVELVGFAIQSDRRNAIALALHWSEPTADMSDSLARSISGQTQG